ncbi:uncharacterized protein LOC121871292 [Homarus americanus]|uniref:Peptidyl-prolyl cis-trans isomerase CYP40-like n=1 Tax=Homarus americanus TaxID=6706 RepID=A0A8J5MUN2_HOMAM|nr:uncharacterized protein LOC121871292 [Homarus americanus]KAG7164693.1 Peptidyl-prolyl cis-trans isomerase CYP40-like [Homarus americanus]
MNDENPLECTLCYEEYNETGRRPRCLPCGHTFCSSCVASSIFRSKVTCPNCRKEHFAVTEMQFPVSYGMEALIRKLRESSHDSPDSDPRHSDPEYVNKRLVNLKREQENSLSGLIAECVDGCSQLDKYLVHLVDWKTEHIELIAKLRNLMEKSEEEIKLLEKEYHRAMEAREDLEKLQQKLKTQEMCVVLADTRTEVITALETCSKWKAAAGPRPSRRLDLFPDLNTVFTSAKVRTSTRAGVQVMVKEASSGPVPLLVRNTSATIQDKIDHITANIRDNKDDDVLTTESLRIMNTRVKDLLKGGRVFTVQLVEGRQRYGQLGLERDNIMVGALQDSAPPPPNAHTLVYSDVCEWVDSSSTMAYLELSWGGTIRGRVLIRVDSDTRLGQQFVLLCTGELGPTYKSTRFIEVINECVYGGDYEYNDGTGGAALQTTVTKSEEYQRPGSGAVVGRWKDDARRAQFGITIREWSANMYEVVIGRVESGLALVAAAVRFHTLQEVVIEDCGIVLEL